MPNRVRSIVGPTGQIIQRSASGEVLDNLLITQQNSYFEDVVSAPIGTYNACYHTSVKHRLTDIGIWPDASSSEYINYGSTEDFELFHLAAELAINELEFGELNFQKNNDFALFELLSDMDEGIFKFFTNMFSFNYGNYRWGILPFISDLKSLVSSLGDLSSKIAIELTKSSAYEAEFIKFIDFSSIPEYGLNGYLKGTFHLQGERTPLIPYFNGLNALQVFLDELGIHPDIKTVWDTIPLSFVVDYFIPIGDALEAFHPRGWYKPEVRFNGNLSYKFECDYNPPPIELLSAVKGRIFSRRVDVNVLDFKPPVKIPDWKLPSALQLFNTAYLALTRRGGGSKVGKVNRLTDTTYKIE